MIIERKMDLGQLLNLMPDDATYVEAETMRAILLCDYLGRRTESIPRPVWNAILAECMPVIDCSAIERRRP